MSARDKPSPPSDTQVGAGDRDHHIKACFIPYDPAARNIPLKGKYVFTHSLFFATLFVMTCEIIVGNGCVSLKENVMWGPSVAALVKTGALNHVTVQEGEWWRLLWAGFMHAGWFHWGMNMIVWVKLGPLMEPEWGFWKLCAVFMAGAFSGNTLSCTLDAYHTSVGASGGMFGVMAALLIYICEYAGSIPNPNIIFWIWVVSLVIGIAGSFIPFVDTYSHIGGLIGGLLAAGVLMSKNEMTLRKVFALRVSRLPAHSPKNRRTDFGREAAKVPPRVDNTEPPFKDDVVMSRQLLSNNKSHHCSTVPIKQSSNYSQSVVLESRMGINNNQHSTMNDIMKNRNGMARINIMHEPMHAASMCVSPANTQISLDWENEDDDHLTPRIKTQPEDMKTQFNAMPSKSSTILTRLLRYGSDLLEEGSSSSSHDEWSDGISVTDQFIAKPNRKIWKTLKGVIRIVSGVGMKQERLEVAMEDLDLEPPIEKRETDEDPFPATCGAVSPIIKKAKEYISPISIKLHGGGKEDLTASGGLLREALEDDGGIRSLEEGADEVLISPSRSVRYRFRDEGGHGAAMPQKVWERIYDEKFDDGDIHAFEDLSERQKAMGNRRKGKSHFPFYGGLAAESKTTVRRNASRKKKVITHLAINPASHRTGLRRTSAIVSSDTVDWESISLWIFRVGCLIALAIFWSIMLYYLLGCESCYHPPGQPLDIRKHKKSL